jgi:hypothetical protein
MRIFIESTCKNMVPANQLKHECHHGQDEEGNETTSNIKESIRSRLASFINKKEEPSKKE